MVKNRLRWGIIAACLLPLCGQGQVKARVAGLETNETYMKLLADEQALILREDSVIRVIEKTRKQFGESDGEQRSKLGADILKLEDMLFDVRNQMGIVTGQANQIEQEFIMNNLDGTAVPAMPTAAPAGGGPQSANLIENGYFRQNLDPGDYAALRRAQGNEQAVPMLIVRFARRHGRAAYLAEAYGQAATATQADSLYALYEEVMQANRQTADSVATIWRKIYDDKVYAYTYLLDKMNRSGELAEFEEKTRQMRDEQAGLSGLYASDAIAFYPLEKSLLTGYELRLAELLKLDKARDSLTKAAAKVATGPIELPRVELEERVFINYQPVAFSSTPKYTARNPIPDDTVYRKGTVYKLLVGTYTKKQVPSLFRGAYPISCGVAEDGRYRYFLGAYATLAEAEEGLGKVKARGFRRPEIVVWEDGVYRNITAAQEAGTEAGGSAALFRVEITSDHGSLPEEVRTVIHELAPGKEVSRSGLPDGRYVFAIGTFDTREAADGIADAVRRQGGMETSVLEIKE
ncbi:MAG: SPOR domain-containing protein [Rikenellaceae bacterium]|nr:SPOR domain-containing protein [Rikenellaceae bacterium]